jgi:hypothetical protein
VKNTIKVWYDPAARVGGKQGAYRSVIVEHPGTRGAGTTAREAAFDVLCLAVSHDLSGDVEQYEFDYSECPNREERQRRDEDQRAVVSLLGEFPFFRRVGNW